MKKTTTYFLVFVAFAITMWVLSNDRFEYPFEPTTPAQVVNVDQITSGLRTTGADTVLETGCDQKITWKQVKGKSCSGRSITWQKPIVTVRDPHLTVIRKEGATLTADSLLRLVDDAGGTIVPKTSDASWTTWPVWDWIANLLRIILVVFIISFLIWLLGWLVQFIRDAWTNWNNQPASVAPVAVQNQQSQPQLQPQPQSQNNYFGGLDSAINLAVQNGRSVELTLKIGGSGNNPSPNSIIPNPSNTDNSDMD